MRASCVVVVGSIVADRRAAAKADRCEIVAQGNGQKFSVSVHGPHRSKWQDRNVKVFLLDFILNDFKEESDDICAF